MLRGGVYFFLPNLRIKFPEVDFYIAKYDNCYEIISGADIFCP